MIIDCDNCNKKFDIDTNLIPEKGRLLQCSKCNHKWFFKKKNISVILEPIQKENPEIFDPADDEQNQSNINVAYKKDTIKNNFQIEEATKDNTFKEKYDENKFNFLSIIIVFIISVIALIILVDTFKYPLSKIYPQTEFLLYSLYESLKDISLFINDLI